MSADATPGVINTDAYSAKLRARAVDRDAKRIRVTRFDGSQQEEDFSEPANCGGLGRIRHFRRATVAGWPTNPLPIDPASKALGLRAGDTMRAQVFQNAVCNWRCWYCFVDFALLSGSDQHSEWHDAGELVRRFLEVDNRPSVLDLTGGQPDLTPEWIPWTMEALRSLGVADSVFLWSDDNLSSDYFWRYLSNQEIRTVREYRLYAKVCCFKGYDPASFAFNTRADPTMFERQFDLMKRVLELGIDAYAYATFTTPSLEAVDRKMSLFVDRLQRLSSSLPLRTVPLFVQPFTPVKGRLNTEVLGALENQVRAGERWQEELAVRFSAAERSQPISSVPLL